MTARLLHVPLDSPREDVQVCLNDGRPWPCPNVDQYWLPKDDTRDFEGVPECGSAEGEKQHLWGPWVLSPVYGNREDRFCMLCGSMEMQTID